MNNKKSYNFKKQTMRKRLHCCWFRKK